MLSGGSPDLGSSSRSTSETRLDHAIILNELRRDHARLGPYLDLDLENRIGGALILDRGTVEFCDAVHSYARDLLEPRVSELEASAAVTSDAQKSALKSIILQSRDFGGVNLTIPESLGGAGMPLTRACWIIEELTRGSRSGGLVTSMMANDLALTPILKAGTEEQKVKFILESLSRGELSSYALTEPDAGSNPAEMRSTLTDKGDHYLLNGTKAWITNHNIADQFVVFAKLAQTTDSHTKPKFCCVVVDARSDGLTLGKAEHKIGQHSSPTGQVIFSDVRVPKDNLIGAEGDGLKIALATLTKSRPMTGAIGWGLIGRALDESVKYANVRTQGGIPIANYQQVQGYLVEMRRSWDENRFLILHAAALEDHGFDARIESSEAKLTAGESVRRVAELAVQVFGGNGYSEEYPVARIFRDAILIGLYEGTNEIQRNIIAKELNARARVN